MHPKSSLCLISVQFSESERKASKSIANQNKAMQSKSKQSKAKPSKAKQIKTKANNVYINILISDRTELIRQSKIFVITLTVDHYYFGR